MAEDISLLLVNVTIHHQLMKEEIVWDQGVNGAHVMKDVVQVHKY